MMDKKLKIIQVLGAKNSGGAELFYLRLAKALQKPCDVLCVVREGSWMESQLKELGLDYKTAPFGGFFDFKTKKLLAEYIEEFKPDVVQGWMNRACKAFPKTNVATVGRLGGYYALKNYKNCDYLVGNTQDLQEYVVKSGRPKRESFYIPNFSPLPDESFKDFRTDVRREYKLPQGAQVLFIAGRLHKVKGIDIAISSLKDLDKNIYLLIAGAGGEEAALRNLAEKEGVTDRVRFAGWVSRLSMVASAADIWLVPSRHEPLGNVVLDAWAHEIPVVAAEASGPKSLIEHKKSGMLVPIDSVKALTQATETVLNDHRFAKSLAKKGALALKNSFSEEIVVEKYLGFYKKISA